MRPPERGDPVESQVAEQLLAYDAALAVGGPPRMGLPDELPAEWRQGISCLDMLERLRLSEVATPASGLRGAVMPPRASSPDTPTSETGTQRIEPEKMPAQLGRFRILKVLGQGGCGVVFLADDPVLHRPLALKIPRPEILLAADVRQRFLREGRAAACLDHPHLVTVFEAGEIGPICYLASAYCPGITLKSWLEQHRTIVSPRGAARLMATLADAMHYAHQKGVCHRDLKPSNVLLQFSEDNAGAAAGFTVRGLEDAVPKIIDFGLAKVLREAANDAVTQSGAVFGTPRYMAPEQAEGKTAAIGPATDVHALGVILYELLTGVTPYQGDSDVEILRRVIDAEPPSPARLCLRLPRDLETICLKCIEKQPARRYGSMKELAEDLERFLEGRAIKARPSGRISRVLKWSRRRPLVAALGGMAGLLSSALIAGWMWVGWLEETNNLGLANALKEAAEQRQLAEQQKWTARNQLYPAQINSSWRHHKGSQLEAMTNLLRVLKPGRGEKDIRGFEWHYLWGYRPRHFTDWKHDAPVSAVAYAHDGEIYASASRDKTIYLSDAHNGRRLGTLPGHQFGISSVAFFGNDTHLVSTGFEKNPRGRGYRGELIVWSLSPKKEIVRRVSYRHEDEIHGHPIFAVAGGAECAFIIDRQQTHRLLKLNLKTGAENLLLSKPRGIGFVATTPGADLIALAYGESLELYDPIHAQARGRIDYARGSEGHTAAFSPDGKMLAIATGWSRSIVEIRDVPSLAKRSTLPVVDVLRGLAFDTQGTRLAVFTPKGGLNLWDIRTNRRSVFVDDYWSATFSPDGGELALGRGDGHVHIRKAPDLEDFTLPAPLPESEAWSVAFSKDGSKLVVGYDHERGHDRETLKIWDLAAQQGKALEAHRGTVLAVAVSPDGEDLATAGYDNTVGLWDMAKLRAPKMLRAHAKPVRAVAYSPDGRLVASAGDDQSIKIWNARDGSLVKSWQAHTDQIRTLAFSADGKLLVSGGSDDLIKMWNVGNYSLARTIQEEHHVQSLACSPDGQLLASGNERNNVNLWDLKTGTLVRIFLVHGGKIRAVAFAPDGRTLASGGEDETIRLWHVLTGMEMMNFPVEHFVNGLAFDRPGKKLAAALHNGTVKVWRAE
jgi:WD40 repeat protein/serine/threonine protein kinase